MRATRQIQVDTVIIGGGVAALWTANLLKKRGYSICLLANAPLGTGQSLAAQGVIHGGIKYAVGGKLNDSSEALAAMPRRWLAAITGDGEIDLSGVELLSDHQLLWSLPGVVSQVVSFF
ncbi:MAG: FAD-dependent oxidoreductase, partial [Verrucomicrobiota bacterium]